MSLTEVLSSKELNLIRISKHLEVNCFIETNNSGRLEFKVLKLIFVF